MWNLNQTGSGFSWVVLVVIGLMCHSTLGHFGDDFYRPDEQTNSVKTLKGSCSLEDKCLVLAHPDVPGKVL